MTEKDAFEFLELPESATRNQVKIRLVEKLEYFQQLKETTTSDFLKRIHEKNMDKVRIIQQQFFPWSVIESGSEVVLPVEAGNGDEEEEEQNYTAPIIVNAGSRQKNPILAKRNPHAWLITHNENSPAIAFPLQPGKNYIGRKKQEGLSLFIEIANDPYVSRIHAVIEILPGKEAECSIDDSAAANQGQESRNGTYINGNSKRIEANRRLKEGETIQVGNTKLVYRNNDQDLEKLLAEVHKMDFTPTVVLR